MLAPAVWVPLSDEDAAVVAGFLWFDGVPVLTRPLVLTGRLADVPAVVEAVFPPLVDGLVLTTDDLFVDGVPVDDTFLPADGLPEDSDACTLLAVLLAEVLLLLTLLLVPTPPLRDAELPNTLSEVV